MKLQRRWLAAAVSTAVLAAGATVLTSSGVAAAGSVAPAITSDPNAANGSIAFFDAAGNRVTSGQLSAPFTSYAVASSTTTRTGTNRASLFVATPDHTKADSQLWFSGSLTAASIYPLAGAPASIGSTAGVPAVKIGSSDGDLAGAFASAVNDPSAGYDHIMQIRMEDSGPGQPASSPFWATDVYVDTTAGTWTQVFPVVATKTGTALTAITANPASPAAHGASVTLTSTLSATDSSHPAGSVHLFDGSTDKGAATFTAATGAVTATDTPADGTHSYTFKFTPSDAATYNLSTSAALSYQVSAATATTTVLSAAPLSPSTVGDSVTFTATVSPTAAGTVQFKDGTTNLGAPVTVRGNTATLTTSALTAASHSITAAFSPTSSSFLASASTPLSYQVNPAPASSTTTSLAVSPASPVDFGTAINLTATVAPNTAAGKVQFLDGSTLLGSPVTVSGGTAVLSTSALASGVHSLTAKFSPTTPASFGASTSSPQSLTVRPQDTTTVLAVSPAGPVDSGTTVTLKATLSPVSATGTVAFFDGSTAIGAPVTVTAGLAQTSTSTLSVATHSLTAQFTPANPASFVTSTSTATSLVVQKPPAGATTTALSVTPAGPIVVGATATLKATVAPASASGTVQFLDGATPIGAPVAVAGGIAHLTDTPALGTHTYSAVFTSSDQTSFKDSTAGSVSLVVKAPATKPATSLTVTPTGTVAHGTSVTFAATVSPVTAGDPAPAGGTVSFLDGTSKLGTATLTAAGTASLTSSTLAGGSHSVTATYLPADVSVFTASTSAPVKLTVKAQATTTTLTSVPVGKVSAGQPVSFIAVVTAGAAGKVSFADGTRSLGLIPVSGGRAKVTTAKLAIGKHTVTATFVPANPAAWLKSRSATLPLTVVAAPKLGSVKADGVSISSGAVLTPGQTLTVTGSGFQPGAQVSVVLESSSVTLTTTSADAAGRVTVTVTLPMTLGAGPHTLILRGAGADADFAFSVEATVASSTPVVASNPVSGSSGSGLASTGAAIYPVLGLGALLLLAGAGFITGARRRRAH